MSADRFVRFFRNVLARHQLQHVPRRQCYSEAGQHRVLQDEQVDHGAGEEAIPQIPPAMLNAVLKITGKRAISVPPTLRALIFPMLRCVLPLLP